MAHKYIDKKNLKLHLGSGADYWNGYINIDLDPTAKTDLVIDVLDLGREFSPDSVSEIIAYHALNHLSLWEARVFLKLSYQLLQNEGHLIIETANLEKALEKIRGSNENFDEYIEGVRALHGFGLDHMQAQAVFTANKFSWTPWHLKRELEQAGFSHVEISSPHSHVVWRDMRVEAIKSSAAKNMPTVSYSESLGNKRILIVLYPPLGTVTVHIRGLIFKESFIENGWTPEYVDIREAGEDKIAEMAANFDIVYLLKIPSFSLVQKLRQHTSAQLIFDLTDALWMPHHRPAGWSDLELILSNVDAVFSDNEFVAEYGRKYNKSVFVIPACTQVEKFDEARSALIKSAHEKIVIGWVGTASTLSALANIQPALENVFQRHPDVELRILAAGCSGEEQLPAFQHVRYSLVTQYNEADMIREVLQMDIGIFPPPVDVEDYAIRGSLKGLIYMTGGIPAVCQNAGDFPGLIEDGVSGMLPATIEDWETKLELLIANPELRKEMGKRGLELVRNKNSLSAVYQTLENALISVMHARTSHPVKVLIFYDEEGWAWWHRAHHIKNNVSDAISVDIKKTGTAFDHHDYDLILLFEYYLFEQVRSVPREKIIVGSSCPKTLEPTSQLIQHEHCLAGLVNNLDAYAKIAHLGNIYCCQNGVDTTLFFPSDSPLPEELTACWVGNANSMGNKGLDLMEEACRLAGIRLFALDLSSKIGKEKIFTQEELREHLYRNASFYLCASEYEGTPNPALEALACGLPVISTRVGNMPEIIVDGVNGFLVDRSVEGILDGINRLKQSNLADMGKNARQSVENGWKWSDQVVKYENMFKELRHKSRQIQTRKHPAHDATANQTSNLPLTQPEQQKLLVTVIVPTYNRPDMLVRALQSVKAQTYPNIEIIVVNDSGLDIGNIIGWLGQDANITYVRHGKNRGLAAARNTALAVARGEIVAYLDDDDVFLPGHVETIVDALVNLRAQFVYTETDHVTETLISGQYVEVGRMGSNDVRYSKEHLHVVNYIPVNTWGHWKSCVAQVGPFDENLDNHEDWDFLLRCSRRFDLVHIPKRTVQVHQRVQGDNMLRREKSKFYNTFNLLYSRYDDLGNPEIARGRQDVLNLLLNSEAPLSTLFESNAKESNPVVKQPEPVSSRSGEKLRCVIYSADLPVAACAFIRLIAPLSRLKNDIEFVWAVSLSNDDANDPEKVSATIDADMHKTADLVIIQRFFPFVAGFQPLLRKILASGKPVIYETDDSLASLPADNPHAQYAEKNRDALLDFVTKCCAITVSTNELRQEYLKLNPGVYVLPNLLDEEKWFRSLVSRVNKSDLVMIGYAGTVTHVADLELVEEALERIAQKYAGKVAFKFIGCATPRLMALPNAEMVKFKLSYDEYPDALRQLGLDIALAPLQDNPFNRCKSNIKWLEYSAVGIAGIYADLPPYNEHVEHMRTGMLAGMDTESWVQALDYLVSNPDARHAMVQAAQNEIKAHYTLESGVHQYLDVYKQIVKLNPVTAPNNDLPLSNETQDDADEVFAKCYQSWMFKHSLQEIDAQLHAERLMLQWKHKPTFHFMMSVTEEDAYLLANTIDSLSAQMYGQWTLSVIAKYPSPDPIFEELPVLQWIEIPPQESYSEGMNYALNDIQSDWVALIEPGVTFEAQLLLAYGDYANIRPHWHLIYCDEDVLESDQTRSKPNFKPDFNLDLLRSMPYFGSLCMVKREALIKVSGYSAYHHAENYDLAFRILETYGESSIGHISDVLCHLPLEKMNCFSETAGKLVLESHLARQKISADVAEGYQQGTFRIDYRFETQPKVSVIIPTRDKQELLQPCVEDLLSKTNYPDFEVIIIDNQSEEPDIFDYYRNLADRFGEKVRVLHYDHDFNYAAISNMGVKEAKGEYVLFLNNDTRVIQPEWLERMVAHGQRKEVGIAGARLIFPGSNKIQHAGVVLGLNTIADHIFLGQLDMNDPGYMGRAHVDQDYSAVTAACMLVRKSLYQDVGGMDEKDLQVSYNDVDLCLKVRKKGYKIVWTPYASLVHDSHSSLRDMKKDPEKMAQNLIKGKHERDTMLLRWLPELAEDSAYNRHLSLSANDARVDSDIVIDWDVNFHDRQRILGVPLPGGSGFYRIIAPFQALSEAGLAQTNVVQTSKMALTRVLTPVELERTHADTIVLHAPLDDLQIVALQDYKKYNSQMRIFMLDDLVTNPPEKSSFFKQSYRDAKPRLRKALSFSDRLIVTTQPLADSFHNMIEDIRIVPNMLRRSQWGGITSKRRQGKKPRVGWAGAQQHQGDLALIFEVVKATSVEVDWIFFGMCLDVLRPYVKEVHEFELSHQDYIEKLASLNLDLAVAPLEVHPFNEAKSNLRLLEYGYLGWPVVCTDIYPYQNAPVKRVANETAAWVEAIRERVNNLDFAEKEGDALQKWVQDNFMIEDHLNDWLAALIR